MIHRKQATTSSTFRGLRKTLDRFGHRFIERVFTDKENRAVRERKGPEGRILCQAVRPPREACSKAPRHRACPMAYSGVTWGVSNLASGKPTMGADRRGRWARLKSMIPEGFEPQIDLTITDEYPLAQGLCDHFCPSEGLAKCLKCVFFP